MLSIIAVAVELLSSVYVIWSPILNSVKNRVPEPNIESTEASSSPIVVPLPSSRTILSPAFVCEASVPSSANSSSSIE